MSKDRVFLDQACESNPEKVSDHDVTIIGRHVFFVFLPTWNHFDSSLGCLIPIL